ncbi:MAG TPA: glycosyltransferase [Solirubrobacteraceae bacterium]|jgi:glycosyltransferase involved in cell wall biosynthesis|nr:glycosyltransferase [Solirubrobacteraceae bacterium]
MADAHGDSRIRALTLGRDVGAYFGGAERLAYEFVKRLDPERFKRYLCVTHARPPEHRAANDRELAQLEESGVEVLRLERESPASNMAWAKLYRLLAEESIDIVHAHMPRAGIPGTIIGRLARVPVIVNHEHTWSYQGKPLRRFLDRNVIARGGDVLLAVSEWDRRRIIEVERIPPECVRIFSNGIAPMPAGAPTPRAQLGVTSDVGLVGALGRLEPQKRHDDLIRAIALLKRAGTPVQCVIAGQGPDRPKLQALIGELGLDEDVRLLGYRDDIAGIIRALDVAALSSAFEGSPLAVMEYMACAAPIVATAVGGVPELIEDGVHGLLVAPGDPPALASAIGRLLEDRALAARLGGAACERQRAEFDLDVVVRRLEQLYLELYEQTRARHSGSRSARRAA